jgi:hypothetical protein
MRGRLLLGLFVVGLVGVSVAAAGLNRNWSVHANGGQEVPAHDTQGQAQAIFHLSTDGSSLEYKLIAANIDMPEGDIAQIWSGASGRPFHFRLRMRLPSGWVRSIS